MPNPAQLNGLKPFTKGDERAKELGRKGGQARARKAQALKEAGQVKGVEVAETLDTLTQRLNRADLGPQAAAIAQLLLGRIAAGDIPVRNGDEAAALLRALVDIARLEEGQATSHTITAHLSTDAAVARVVELQARARAELSTTSSTPALEDTPADMVVEVAGQPSPQ